MKETLIRESPVSETDGETLQPYQTDVWGDIGLPARGVRLHQLLDTGIPLQVVKGLANTSGFDLASLARYTCIAPATYQRRVAAGRFKKDESDRIYRFAEVFNAANNLFEGDTDAARHWLRSEIAGLGNTKPVDMISTSAGTEAVLDLIGRLEHGVFA